MLRLYFFFQRVARMLNCLARIGRSAAPADAHKARKRCKRRCICAARIVQQKPAHCQDLPIKVRGQLRSILRDGVPHALQAVERSSERMAAAFEQLRHSG